MGEIKGWFEGELRRMLGFDEVEDIAKFALGSFPASQPVELKQYLEQFLGQSKEVDKLCAELSARRRGTPAAPTGAAASKTKPNPSDDFWGAAGGRGSSVSRTAGSVPSLAGRGGGQEGKILNDGAIKGKGKVYQKSAAEEDFWGGGTTSGRSTSVKSAPKPPAAVAASRPSQTPTSAPGLIRPATSSTQKRSKGNAKGGGRLPAATAKAKAKEPSVAAAATHAQPPAAPPAARNKAGAGRAPVARSAGAPPKSVAGAATVAPPAPTEPAPEWSGVTCQCMGKNHDLVTNCTSCGKIACVMEGGFGCSFCGSRLPVTGREPRYRGSDVRGGKGDTGTGGGGGAVQSAALKEALERKDKLLLFDRTSASRTRVLDDQGDYFTSHNWLSQREREKGEAEEKTRRDDAAQRSGARRQVKLSIDIMGRRVVETQQARGEGKSEGAVEAAATEGVSLDLGYGPGGAAGRNGGGDAVVGPGTTNSMADVPDLPSGGGERKLSLENTGLRGRAKEVYDVMRANLEKRGRRQPGCGGARGAGVVAEKSRVSLWRVQHDVDSDDLLRQNRPGDGDSGGSGSGGVGLDGFGIFEPRDELPCASG